MHGGEEAINNEYIFAMMRLCDMFYLFRYTIPVERLLYPDELICMFKFKY